MSEQISRMAPGRVMTATREVSISEAARLMHMLGIGSLVIVDDANAPIAIVTDRDLVAKIATGIDPRETPVGSCASSSLIKVGPDCETAEAVGLMKRHGIRRVPVVDDAGALRGMVTMDDLLLELGAEGGGLLSDLADAIRAGADQEHPEPSAHERSI